MTANPLPPSLTAVHSALMAQNSQNTGKAVLARPSLVAQMPSQTSTPGTPAILTPTVSESSFCVLPEIDSLSGLPHNLQQILRNLPFFPRDAINAEVVSSGILDEFLTELSNVVHVRSFCAGDVITQEGEKARAMFFLIKGIVKVISEDGEINFAELRPGSYFGEIGVLLNMKRTATVAAKTKCALAIVTSENLQCKLQKYPQIAEIIRGQANQRLEETRAKQEKAGIRPEARSSENSAESLKFERSGSLRELSASRAASRRQSGDCIGIVGVDTARPLQQKQGLGSCDDFSISPIMISEDLPDLQPAHSGVQPPSEPTESASEGLGTLPSNMAANFANRYGGRRRASVAVWSDDRLMQFAQSANDRHEVCEKHVAKVSSILTQGSTTAIGMDISPALSSSPSPNTSQEYGILGREIMTRILGYLNFRARMRIRLVSMQLLRLLLDPRAQLTTDVDLSPWHKRIDDKVIGNVVCFCGQTVRSLSLRNCWSVSDKGLAAIAHYAGSGLETLSLNSVWDITDAGLASMARMCVQLQTLDLSNCRKLSDSGVLSVLDACPKIECLTLSYCKFLSDKVLKHVKWKALKRLNLQRCTGIRDDGFANWVAIASQPSPDETTKQDGNPTTTDGSDNEDDTTTSQTQLASQRCFSMQLDPDRMINDEESRWGTPSPLTASPVPITGFALQELVLSDCSFLTDTTVTSVAASCHRLQYLSLSFCCAVTEDFADKLVKGCPDLRALDMSFCGTAVTDANLLKLAQGLRALERLSIRGCIQVTERGIMYLARYARCLRMLNVSQCKNVTEESVRRTGKGWRLLTCQGLVDVDEADFRNAERGKRGGRRERARASTA
ncbi:uncharacterized protein EV422DRAFT_381018 [Fimicolochytrium jonesii]|uniref:uncharacterized protein n=1 Tax=Fimicolochytrium jonesii TaxID=1396493 RepID=UPI0022FDD493|nr:uncharacterized protein EV422DRAFT_381018 [Fimicolochytrium jonesii]KAI8822849.1 hypothetical protein EV422DRAFT_381018 [Fimicolochytrium jonesii]